MAPKRITPADRLYFELRHIRKQIDLVLKEYAASMPAPPPPKERPPLIDAKTKQASTIGRVNGKPRKTKQIPKGDWYG